MSITAMADANLLEAFRAYARWQAPSETLECDGMLLNAGATPFPASFANAALRTDSSLPPAVAVRAAHEFFAARARGYTFVARSHCDADLCAYLTLAGFERMFDSPCMLIETALPDKDLPDGIHVERLDSADRIADLVAVGIDAYGSLSLPEKAARAAFSNPAGLFDGSVTGFIAYRGAKPVSIALAVHSGGSAGVYWVGTIESERGIGLGEHCTRLAANAGFERGARVVTLQASPQGLPIYRRMGFREYDRRVDFRKPK